jgi:hypothetical protein
MDDDVLRIERAKFAMEEFKMLNAEILQRNTVLMQIMAGGMAAIVALIAAGGLSICLKALLIFLIVSFIIVAWLLVHVDAIRASSRIKEIEVYVSECVGGDDNNPLSWQRRSGLDQRGYWDRLVEILSLLSKSVKDWRKK